MTVSHPYVPQRKKALLIGICYSTLHKQRLKDDAKPPINKISTTHKNTKELHRFVADVLHYREEDIVVMLDKKRYRKELVPTRANILQQISKLVEGAKKGDHFVLCYSGHSKQVPVVEDIHEEDGLDEAIIGSDGEVIIDDDLYKILADPLPAGCHLVVLWDTCHSGTMLDLPYKFPRSTHVLDRREIGSGCAKQSSEPRPTRNSSNEVASRRFSLDNIPVQRRVTGSAWFIDSITEEEGKSVSEKAVLDRPLCVSPAPGSPTSFHTSGRMSIPRCLGRCNHRKASMKRAFVISIAACRDDQLAWESPGEMTLSELFVKELTSHPDLTIRQLYQHLEEHVVEMTKKRRQDLQDVRSQQQNNRNSSTSPTTSQDAWGASQHVQFTTFSSNLNGNIPLSKYFG